MDKYGVVTEPEGSKSASESAKPTCPHCGAELAPAAASNVPICPKCGTKPFEAKT